MPSYGGRLAGHAYGGRSLANWDSVLRERQRERVIETLEALNQLFPPCSLDTLMEWVRNGEKLGLVTRNEVILVMAYRSEFNGLFGTREVVPLRPFAR
jgi:hypothetical protein